MTEKTLENKIHRLKTKVYEAGKNHHGLGVLFQTPEGDIVKFEQDEEAAMVEWPTSLPMDPFFNISFEVLGLNNITVTIPKPTNKESFEPLEATTNPWSINSAYAELPRDKVLVWEIDEAGRMKGGVGALNLEDLDIDALVAATGSPDVSANHTELANDIQNYLSEAEAA